MHTTGRFSETRSSDPSRKKVAFKMIPHYNPFCLLADQSYSDSDDDDLDPSTTSTSAAPPRTGRAVKKNRRRTNKKAESGYHRSLNTTNI